MFKFLIILLLPLIGYCQNVKTYIPKNAYTYLPVLKKEVNKEFPDIITPYYFAALAEQESCISLTHKRCWDPRSQLKTKREEGAGIFQLTKAYNKDGSERFDSLHDLRAKHFDELKDLSWDNIYQRPDLQIKSMLLMFNDNYKQLYSIPNFIERLSMSDGSYNAGLSRINARRRLCSLSENCNPKLWFANTEKQCSTGNKALYGNRTACDITNEHVYNDIKLRMNKYKPFFE